MKYNIIYDRLPELQERVTVLLNQGWKLYGNPFQGAHGWFYQAIILEVTLADEQIIELERDLDETLIQNATLKDEVRTLENLLHANGIESPL